MELATREVFWQIPFSFKVIMYITMFLAMGIMIYGLWKKLQFASADRGFKSLLPKKLNWKSFIETIFFTGKVARDSKVGIFHSLIYYGFIILLIATELVAIHADSPFKVYQGTTYIVISFLADFAGLAILIGLAWAFKRRYIDKPIHLSATKPKQELFMYGILFLLVVVGYLLEGMRIVGAGMPSMEASWSPIGWIMAKAFLGMQESTLIFSYQALWIFHMFNTMLFIGSIGYSKFSHIFTLPFAALITPRHRGAVMEPMDFTDETAETFGLGKVQYTELYLHSYEEYYDENGLAGAANDTDKEMAALSLAFGYNW